MNSLEWEIFKRTGKIEHYLLVKEREIQSDASNVITEFAEEFIETEYGNVARED
ncbi:MAG: YqzL family protein [Turicibacter sp.]